MPMLGRGQILSPLILGQVQRRRFFLRFGFIGWQLLRFNDLVVYILSDWLRIIRLVEFAVLLQGRYGPDEAPLIALRLIISLFALERYSFTG